MRAPFGEWCLEAYAQDMMLFGQSIWKAHEDGTIEWIDQLTAKRLNDGSDDGEQDSGKEP